MNDRCESCRHFNDTGQYGQCRYDPPRIVCLEGLDLRHEPWPVVERHWWCDRFQRAMGGTVVPVSRLS